MPTQHVEPQSDEHLGNVAQALLKARKVVVITGAGISTNSGIPDFRSDNGLYSLIQAQFDAAARQVRRPEPADGPGDGIDGDDPYPTKRRKIGPQPSLELLAGKPATADSPGAAGATSTIHVAADDKESRQRNCDTRPAQPIRTPQAKPVPLLTTSPLSSPPADDSMIPPPTLIQSPIRKHLADVSLPPSSSPLSSPPPALFDPFVPSSPSATGSSRRSSTSTSEVDDSPPSTNTLSSSSHVSSAGRGVLPNMKGKDLFDAAIWSDPLRTSVFYTFATSLRQKIRTAEPSSSHRFISHLRDRGKLVRCYTQNIDQIEEKVGLSTCLQDGPGSRGRFSRRSTATANQLGKMVEEAAAPTDRPPGSEQTSQQQDQPPNSESSPSSQAESPDGTNAPATGTEGDGGMSTDGGKPAARPQKKEVPRSGVECVFLHGSLELLRCFLCGRVCSWDDGEREAETLAGQQPECPHCVGATAAREERGKRALGVGKLRPDIVLYGEEHPSSHLISPIVTHDLALHPDLLLILGTSLRVHGLKVMVREFAKAVHSKSGKVVFVNFTKPPESSWGDIIDYWVQWDCDAWVADLHGRIPKLWQDPEPARCKKRDGCDGKQAKKAKEDKKQKRPPAANPVALRDTKGTGAYWTSKVLLELRRITGRATATARGASASADEGRGSRRGGQQSPDRPPKKGGKTKARQPRKSAAGAPERRTGPPPSTLNPNHGRSKKQDSAAAARVGGKAAISSILNAVKENARVRKRKVVEGEETAAAACAPRRRGRNQGYRPTAAELKLPPLRSLPAQQSPAGCPHGRPQPLEPRSPPSGPLASLSPNLRNARAFQRPNAFYLDDSLVRLMGSGLRWAPMWRGGEDVGPPPLAKEEEDEAEEAEAGAMPAAAVGGTRPGSRGNLEGQLMDWGANWSCKR